MSHCYYPQPTKRGRVQKIVGGVTQFRNTILLFYKHIIPHETYATELSRVRGILKFLVGEKQKIFEARQILKRTEKLLVQFSHSLVFKSCLNFSALHTM